MIDQIRSDVNILDIVGQYVQLHRSGSNWFGLCPFHTEKTGSFSVNEPKQFFHCFSCGRGGNVFKFLMEIEDLTFPEAVYRTAELAGIELDAKYLPQNVAGAEDTQSETGKLKRLYAQAGQLYHHILVNTKLGQPALDHLHERGLSDELIAEFQLGYVANAEPTPEMQKAIINAYTLIPMLFPILGFVLLKFFWKSGQEEEGRA